MRLLAVHAHPDDETLSTGPLLAAWARTGEAFVVSCTRGERGEVLGPLHALEGDGPALAAHRTTELAAALAALGVSGHAFLDALPVPAGARALPATVVDSGMRWVDVPGGTAGPADDAGPSAFTSVPAADAAAVLAAHVRALAPDVVVTYDAGGGYGHPDHVRTHDVTVRALALLAAAGVDVPPLLCPSTPPATDAAVRAHLADARWVADVRADHGLTLPAAGRPPAVVAERRIVAEVDVTDVLDDVVGALRAHATQVTAVTAAPASDPLLAGVLALSNLVVMGLPRVATYALLGADGGVPGTDATARWASVPLADAVRRVA
ncbi:PIG-L family deacetylase [Sanguibacter sp. HDW7]|uniref:PIG-L family deacetylase n=1 Tax=Sanguibacter sp. HDW7 TaxID=2714931 RepID=UPI00140A5D38|nr:PIG-L family deacetylase [Sanguibacter sp. HDW7]QIK84039.1 GlcNAc-PI de-N-acetylase [Sanguibacter sp. HDW7]